MSIKTIITSGVLALVFVVAPSLASAAFEKDLQVGSSGNDIITLQTWLISNGFDIPAISKGEAQKGTFGSQTRAALQKYQKSVGLPSTGFFGPLTRGKLNGNSGVGSVVSNFVTNCPAGYVCKPQVGQVLANPGTITTPGVAGTLAFTIQGSPSGASLDKGEKEDVVRYKAQAAASDMRVTSLALDFDVRLWLYASAVTVKDDSGAIIATKSNLSASDFTELSSSDFRLNIPMNYVVPKTQTRYFIVSVSMLPVTDRSSGTITINDAVLRSVDGTGVADTQTEATDRTFTFTGGNPGQIVITANEKSPLNSVVQISTTAETDNVVLAVANFKSRNKSGVAKKFSIYLTTNGVVTPANLFSDVKIVAGNLSYSPESIANGNAGALTVFNNMNIPLPADQNVPISIVLKLKASTNNSLDGAKASTTILAAGTAGGASNNPVVEDELYNTIDINDAPLVSGELTFTSSGVTIINGSANTPQSVGSTSAAYNIGFKYTLLAGDNPLYVSRSLFNSSGTAQTVSTSTTGGISARLTTLTAEPDSLAGDSATEYLIPAGSARTFTISGSATGSSRSGQVKVTALKYGTTSGTYTQEAVGYYLGLLQTNSIVFP